MSMYAAHLVSMLSIYVVLAASLNLVAGYGGMLSAAHVVLFGVGAYALACLTSILGWPFLIALPISIVAAGSLAFVVGSLCVRLSGDFFLLATLSVHVLLQAVFANWIPVTGGPYGIGGIASPSAFGWSADSSLEKAFFTAAAAGGSLAILGRLLRSPFVRSLQAIRDNAVAAGAVGKDPLRFRRRSFMIAGAFAGLAGALYASNIGYIDPHAFALDEFVFLLAVVVVGGAGDARGPVVGTLVLFLMPEGLRLLPITAAAAANARQVLFGLLLVLAMRVRPQGLVGRYGFN